jgi:YHS domain-containing protein
MTPLKITLASFATLAFLSSPALAQHGDKHGTDGRTEPRVFAPASEQNAGDPYTLDTCPISGMKLGAMGEAIVKVYDGREVRFCCNGCPEKFEADMEANFKKLDAKLVENQLPYYPLTTCVVSGEPLSANGEDVAMNMIFGNRLVRLCCKECISDFKADPAAYTAKLDAAVMAAQRESYPLDTCVVSDEELGGDMGEVIEVVVANRLVRLCCKGCKKDLLKDPASFVKTLDAAWAASPNGMPGASNMSMSSGMGEHKGMKNKMKNKKMDKKHGDHKHGGDDTADHQGM